MKKLRNAACEYADRGWAVLPLAARTKQPAGLLVPFGNDNATTDLTRVLAWWTRSRRLNVGINCHASGLVVVDVDPRNDGDDELYEAQRELGKLPDTVTALSGGGGSHYYFRHPGGVLVGRLAPGLDIKDHGYVLAPPSVHPSGTEYVWEWGASPSERELADLPAKWVERLRVPPCVVRVPRAGARAITNDALRQIDAAIYVPTLSARAVDRSRYVRCPFHGGGKETKPSLRVDGRLWSCYGCPPPVGARVQGGDIYTFAALMWGFAVPLRGSEFREVKERLRAIL